MYAEETHDGQKCIALCWIVYPSGIYGIIIVKARLCAYGFEGTQNMKKNSPNCLFQHSHKKRKDSLETRAEKTVFPLTWFPKIIRTQST